MQFLCNICGFENHISSNIDMSTPGPLCAKCKSSVRFRLIAFAFSKEIMNGDGFIPKTIDNDYVGIGLSDSAPLAKGFERFHGYTNTFFHKEPRLDITKDTLRYKNLDYIISSDVFEHTKPPALAPFCTASKMLRAGGKLLLSVPMQKSYVEHFPNLNNFEIIETGNGYILANATTSGNLELFSNLRFHGGPGSTLEMRVHSRESVDEALSFAGFRAWKEINPDHALYGIFPLTGLSTVIVAER